MSWLAEIRRQSRKRDSPDQTPVEATTDAALGSVPGSLLPLGEADAEDTAKQRIMQYAARVNPGRMQGLSAITVASALAGSNTVHAALSLLAQPVAPTTEAVTRLSAAAPPSFNSELRQMNAVRRLCLCRF